MRISFNQINSVNAQNVKSKSSFFAHIAIDKQKNVFIKSVLHSTAQFFQTFSSTQHLRLESYLNDLVSDSILSDDHYRCRCKLRDMWCQERTCDLEAQVIIEKQFVLENILLRASVNSKLQSSKLNLINCIEVLEEDHDISEL